MKKILNTTTLTFLQETTFIFYTIAFGWINSIKCFEKRDTKEKLRLNCGVTAELCHSALARSECDDWPVGLHTQAVIPVPVHGKINTAT